MWYTALLSQTLGNRVCRVILLLLVLLSMAYFPFSNNKMVSALQFRVMIVCSNLNLDRLVVYVAQSILLLMYLLVINCTFDATESLRLCYQRFTSIVICYLLPIVAIIAACCHARPRLVLEAFLGGSDGDLLPTHNNGIVR